MRAFFWLTLATAMGCTTLPTTEILVVSETDLSVPDELDAIRIVVTGPEGLVQEVRADVGLGAPRPVTLALVSGASLPTLEVVAIGERNGAEVLRRTARVMFVPDQIVVLRVDLWRHCVDVHCGSGLTCAESGCRSVDVAPTELTPWTGSVLDPPTPMFDASVMSDTAPDDDAADDADLDTGGLDTIEELDTPILDVGGLDGGVLDTGAPDAGRDAGRDAGAPDVPIDAGRRDAPIDTGFDAGRPDTFVPECTTAAECADGVSCTTDTCSGLICVHTPSDIACDDAIACTSETCNATSGCVVVTSDAACSDGVACTTDRCDRFAGCGNTPVHSACAMDSYCDPLTDCTPNP